MKITNGQMVEFLNQGEALLKYRMPRKLYTAISLNMEAMKTAAELYEKQRVEIITEYAKKDKENAPVVENGVFVIDNPEMCLKEINELLKVDVELSIQKVSEEVFDIMDRMDKYDSLTGNQYQALSFMIEERMEG